MPELCTMVVCLDCPEQTLREPLVLQSCRQQVVILQDDITCTEHATKTYQLVLVSLKTQRQTLQFTLMLLYQWLWLKLGVTGRWRCSQINPAFGSVLEQRLLLADIWNYIWHSLAGSFILWTVTLGIPGPETKWKKMMQTEECEVIPFIRIKYLFGFTRSVPHSSGLEIFFS